MIQFNIPPYIGTEMDYIKEAIANHKICGDGMFTKKCSDWIQNETGSQKILLTTSGTSALEMAALLCDLTPGDEVILPSYTFSSTATAFVLVGARLVFVDIRPDTMNIDEKKIRGAITEKTKALCVMHYGGISCEMDEIMMIAHENNLIVIEDAAQSIKCTYKGKKLGTIGDFGCFSFHETKNYSMGEGGALLIADSKYNDSAEILREKGTNRSQFFRGQIAKYNWVDYGSSYLPSDMLAAYLWAQLLDSKQIDEKRIQIWDKYREAFKCLNDKGIIEWQYVPEDCTHNAHLFYIKCKNIETRGRYIDYMRKNNVLCAFHYVPLHSAPAGNKYGLFSGKDVYTTIESNRLVRLPLYYNFTDQDQEYVIKKTIDFFESEKI